MTGGKIDCYLDLASFYSYIAFADLLPNLEKLAAHGVEVEFHPVLLGAINHLTGNQPPWKVPAKGRYLDRDLPRAASRVNISVSKPEDFMAMTHTTSPGRALHYIKANYPTTVYLTSLQVMFDKFWSPPHVNLTEEGELRKVLREDVTTDGDKGDKKKKKKLFGEEDVERIMSGREAMKKVLIEVTGRAVESGAFGAPWFVVRSARGEEDTFFGSDRFNHIYRHLGIPFQDIAIQPPPAKL